MDLALAKEIYAGAVEHAGELCAPYATVIDIDFKKLPSIVTVNGWSAAQFTAALRHDQKNPALQSPSATIDPCRLQNCGQDGRPLS